MRHAQDEARWKTIESQSKLNWSRPNAPDLATTILAHARDSLTPKRLHFTQCRPADRHVQFYEVIVASNYAHSRSRISQDFLT